MLNYRPNERRRFGRSSKRLLDEAETGLSRPSWWRMMMMITAVRGKKINFTLEQAMKAQGRVEVYLSSFLTSALDGGVWSTPCPGRFTFAKVTQCPLYRRLGGPQDWPGLRGRPRNRWQNEVREDGRIVGGEGWQVKVHNREEWKKPLRTARNRRILHVPKK